MEHNIREHVTKLFADAPGGRQTIELREEMIQNLTEKYRDLLQQGKSEESAYQAVIAGIGDVDSLLRELTGQPPAPVENKKRAAGLTTLAIMLYILCVVPLFLMQNAGGLVVMFLFIAAATGILIYVNMTNPAKQDAQDTSPLYTDPAQDARAKELRKAVHGAIWAIMLASYFILSFSTGAWHITWLVFPISGAVSHAADAAFALYAQRKEQEQ